MVKTKADILNAVKGIVGENEDDSVLSVLEDISDTLDDYETKSKDTTDWKTKYSELDSTWRKRYKERFFGTDDNNNPPPEDDNDGGKDETKTTFDELFT